MSKLVSTGQRLVTGVKSPKAVYARVVTAFLQIKNAPLTRVTYTMPVANKFWLLGIDLRHRWIDPGGTADLTYQFYWGMGEPANRVEMERWTPILPINWPPALRVEWQRTGDAYDQHWDMCMLIEGMSPRLGMWLMLGGISELWESYVSFLISEG